MVLFGAFNIVAVLVALNMLIAMLNESYTRITVNATLNRLLLLKTVINLQYIFYLDHISSVLKLKLKVMKATNRGKEGIIESQ